MEKEQVKPEETTKVREGVMQNPDPEPKETQEAIGIEIGAIATLIATGYTGQVERTYTILGKNVTVSFTIPK